MYIKERIWELKKLRVMRNIEKMNNSKTCQFFEKLCKLKNLLIFKFDNSKILLKFWRFPNLSNIHNSNFFLNLKIYKIHKIY